MLPAHNSVGVQCRFGMCHKCGSTCAMQKSFILSAFWRLRFHLCKYERIDAKFGFRHYNANKLAASLPPPLHRSFKATAIVPFSLSSNFFQVWRLTFPLSFSTRFKNILILDLNCSRTWLFVSFHSALLPGLRRQPGMRVPVKQGDRCFNYPNLSDIRPSFVVFVLFVSIEAARFFLHLHDDENDYAAVNRNYLVLSMYLNNFCFSNVKSIFVGSYSYITKTCLNEASSG